MYTVIETPIFRRYATDVCEHFERNSTMDADMNQFAADLLQSVREMKADVRASETKVPVSQVLAAPF